MIFAVRNNKEERHPDTPAFTHAKITKRLENYRFYEYLSSMTIYPRSTALGMTQG